MRDPQRLVDDKAQPELRQLLLAAKHDGPPRTTEAKQRVKAAVLAHMRVQNDVRQSGVRRIDNTTRDRIEPAKPQTNAHSWADQVRAFFLLAAALATTLLIVRHAYVTYAEQAHPQAPLRKIEIAPPNLPTPPVDEEMEEHQASITVTEEKAPSAESESEPVEPEENGPPRELVLKLKHRAHKSGIPRVLIRSACSDPNDWSRNVEMDYPTDAYNAGVSGTLNVSCNLSAEGSFGGCVTKRPPGFTSGDIGRVLMTMNSWTLIQSMADWGPQTRRCKIDVVFDLDKKPKSAVERDE